MKSRLDTTENEHKSADISTASEGQEGPGGVMGRIANIWAWAVPRGTQKKVWWEELRNGEVPYLLYVIR